MMGYYYEMLILLSGFKSGHRAAELLLLRPDLKGILNAASAKIPWKKQLCENTVYW
jgi:hypothetical protein